MTSFDGPESIAALPWERSVAHEAGRGRVKLAIFEPAACVRCPLLGICPTQCRGPRRVLPFTLPEVAVARRRAEQETPEFKERHKIRSGIEATNSEFKRCHGLGKLLSLQSTVTLSLGSRALADSRVTWDIGVGAIGAASHVGPALLTASGSRLSGSHWDRALPGALCSYGALLEPKALQALSVDAGYRICG